MVFLSDIAQFFSFQNLSVNIVVFGTMLLGACSALIGTFSFLQKRALIGDTIAHALLPGICIAFLIHPVKNPWVLITGAIISGLISIYVIDYIKANSKLKNDTIIALTLSLFFGIGLFLLGIIQQGSYGSQSGIDHFLFGKAAALMKADLIAYGLLAFSTILIIVLFYRAFFITTFDENFAKSINYPVKTIKFILSTLTVIAIAIGIQTVGVVLMAAMLVTPAAGARYWTNNLKYLLLGSAILGSLSGFFGAFISYTAPQMPTGPWIVLSLSVFTISSILFAPKKGLFQRFWKKKKWQERLELENILKTFYLLGEEDKQFQKARNLQEIIHRRFFETASLKKHLQKLVKQEKLIQVNEKFTLTATGKHEGQRLSKIHRLWEMYLTTELNIAPDHVHEDAESIEHIITPEIERKLEEALGFPEKDPHERNIPYR